VIKLGFSQRGQRAAALGNAEGDALDDLREWSGG
jgi:hypothetical protein